MPSARLPSRGWHVRRGGRRRDVRLASAEGQRAGGPDETRLRDLLAAEIRSDETLSGRVRDRRIHGHREDAPRGRSTRRGPDVEARPPHPNRKDGPDDRPAGRLLHPGRRESIYQLDRDGPIRRLSAEGNHPIRGIEVSCLPPRHLGEVVGRIRLDCPGNAAPRYLVRAGGSFRGRPLRVLLRHGFPESPRGIPAARGPGEMAPLVLAGTEPAPGGDVPGPEHDRDGGALLAESAEQGNGNRLSVRP